MTPKAAHELHALYEILDVARADLQRLLTADHPPADYLAKIATERKTIEDIEYLVADLEAQIASKDLHKYIMDQHVLCAAMSRVHI